MRESSGCVDGAVGETRAITPRKNPPLSTADVGRAFEARSLSGAQRAGDRESVSDTMTSDWRGRATQGMKEPSKKHANRGKNDKGTHL